MNAGEQQMLLFFLKTLADESRLTVLGLLSQQERNVTQLAELLKLTEPTVSHHLSKLRTVGLLNLRTEGNQRFYRLNATALNTFKQLVANIENQEAQSAPVADQTWIDALDLPEADRKVLRDYTKGQRLTQLPMKQKKLVAVLHWVITKFQPEIKYSEKDVNAILKECFDDYVTLRRELVDFGFLRRERGGGKYWLAPDGDAA